MLHLTLENIYKKNKFILLANTQNNVHINMSNIKPFVLIKILIVNILGCLK